MFFVLALALQAADFSLYAGGGKQWSGTVIKLLRSGELDITFIFTAQKDERLMVKWKLRP